MGEWHKFNEIALSEKDNFYINLNMEDITDLDYNHAKRFCKHFEIKNLGKYHDLYLKSDLSLLADVFQNFAKMCLEISELQAPGLAWQVTLKKTQVELELLTGIDMLLTIEKGVKGGICHSINRYPKAYNKYMKDYDKNKESTY